MMISPVSPSFNGNIVDGIKKTIADPTDVNNKEAVVSGTVAAGGVGGAAVVASRFKTLRTMAMTGQKYISGAANLKNNVISMRAKNLSILSEFATKVTKFFKSSKMTSWISKLMETPVGKKLTGAFIGFSALGITAAQLYSAGDMAVEAVKNK